MKNLLLLSLFFFFHFSAIAQSKRYFDVGGTEVSKNEFDQLRTDIKYLVLKETSVNQERLVFRQEKGQIADFKAFKKIFESQSDLKLSDSSISIILYYPGKDPCNTSGGATEKSKKAWHNDLDKKIKKLTTIAPIYICKNLNDMDQKGSAILSWIADPFHIVEQTFFKRHYPCGSFVVLSPSGDYQSHFGEYYKDLVLNTIKEVQKLNHK